MNVGNVGSGLSKAVDSYQVDGAFAVLYIGEPRHMELTRAGRRFQDRGSRQAFLELTMSAWASINCL